MTEDQIRQIIHEDREAHHNLAFDKAECGCWLHVLFEPSGQVIENRDVWHECDYHSGMRAGLEMLTQVGMNDMGRLHDHHDGCESFGCKPVYVIGEQ